MLKTERRKTFSALLSTRFELCAARATLTLDMFIHVVRSVDWSQRPMHRYDNRPLPLNMYGRLVPLLSTAKLKPLCLISVENFPAVGKLYYSTAILLFVPHMMYT